MCNLQGKHKQEMIKMAIKCEQCGNNQVYNHEEEFGVTTDCQSCGHWVFKKFDWVDEKQLSKDECNCRNCQNDRMKEALKTMNKSDLIAEYEERVARNTISTIEDFQEMEIDRMRDILIEETN